ncbi:hypothetical protein P7C70_g7411, partial [Phenoliferia sp. Uapishka_3]
LRPGSDDIVIADFGIAKHLDEGEVLTSLAGSPGYAAPEVLLKKGHGAAVDLWSIGVITYTLLCGYTPFRATETKELADECSAARLEFHDRYWKNVSEEARDFIKHLIRPNPSERPTATQALGHKWLTDHNPSVEHDLSSGLRENWNSKRRWKATVNSLIATSRLAKAGAAARERRTSEADALEAAAASKAVERESESEGEDEFHDGEEGRPSMDIPGEGMERLKVG